MTVKELMEQLQKYPDDYNIFVGRDNYCGGYDEFYIANIYDSDRKEGNDKEVIIEIY